MFPIIDAGEFLLREMTADDANGLFYYYSDPEIMKYTSTNAHKTIAETHARIEKLSSSLTNGNGIPWVLEHKRSGKVVGDIGVYHISPNDKRAGVGFIIAKEHWGKGYGTSALKLVLAYIFEHTEVNRIESTCKVENIASARVMEKSGMRCEGILRQYSYKDGKYHDVKMYSILKSDILTGYDAISLNASGIRYIVDDKGLSAADFLSLAQQVWPGSYSADLTQEALRRTINITAWDIDRLIGCVRILTDGYYFSTIPEILVIPAYQKRGIGKHLMELAWEASPTSLFFGAQPGNEGFFEKLGYVKSMQSYSKRKPRKA